MEELNISKDTELRTCDFSLEVFYHTKLNEKFYTSLKNEK